MLPTLDARPPAKTTACWTARLLDCCWSDSALLDAYKGKGALSRYRAYHARPSLALPYRCCTHARGPSICRPVSRRPLPSGVPFCLFLFLSLSLP
jgi:hypothetical protein